MKEGFSRREFLKLTSATGVVMLLTGCQGKDVTAENRSIVDRVMGRPNTDLPQVEGAWTYENNVLAMDMTKLPELESLGGAVRIEGDVLPDPVLVVYGEDSAYYAYKNVCPHVGRKIDPLIGTMTLECCSISGSTFDYEGKVLSGPAKEAMIKYAVTEEGEVLKILMNL